MGLRSTVVFRGAAIRDGRLKWTWDASARRGGEKLAGDLKDLRVVVRAFGAQSVQL
jgi:hypothetical protein